MESNTSQLEEDVIPSNNSSGPSETVAEHPLNFRSADQGHDQNDIHGQGQGQGQVEVRVVPSPTTSQLQRLPPSLGQQQQQHHSPTNTGAVAALGGGDNVEDVSEVVSVTMRHRYEVPLDTMQMFIDIYLLVYSLHFSSFSFFYLFRFSLDCTLDCTTDPSFKNNCHYTAATTTTTAAATTTTNAESIPILSKERKRIQRFFLFTRPSTR